MKHWIVAAGIAFAVGYYMGQNASNSTGTSSGLLSSLGL